MSKISNKTKGWLAGPARPAEAPAKAEARRGKGWPPSRRAAQAARIRRQRPWLRSTGPRTPAGKARTRLNAQKPHTAILKRWKSLLREHRRFLRMVDACYLMTSSPASEASAERRTGIQETCAARSAALFTLDPRSRSALLRKAPFGGDDDLGKNFVSSCLRGKPQTASRRS